MMSKYSVMMALAGVFIYCSTVSSVKDVKKNYTAYEIEYYASLDRKVILEDALDVLDSDTVTSDVIKNVRSDLEGFLVHGKNISSSYKSNANLLISLLSEKKKARDSVK